MPEIGLMGGSFNPIHCGHVALARAALNSGKVERVLFLPTGNPPHKREGLADKFDRLRPAEEADECRLTELDALNASVLESLLKEANVPYIARPMMGAGISAALGVTLEKFVFFVAYRDYARAQEQLEALLAPDDHAADADFADGDEESEDEDE